MHHIAVHAGDGHDDDDDGDCGIHCVFVNGHDDIEEDVFKPSNHHFCSGYHLQND